MDIKRYVQIASLVGGVAASGAIAAAVGLERFWVTPTEYRVLAGELDFVSDDVKENKVDILILRRNAYLNQLFQIESELKKYQTDRQPETLKHFRARYRRDIEFLDKKILELGGIPQ